MRYARKIGQGLIAGLMAWFLIVAPAQAAHDTHHKPAVDRVHGSLSVMVLGSGGPVAMPSGRASAGYLIFTDGKPRLLMDVGGGTFKSLAASGTNVKDLDLILLSHLHVDHTSDLPAIIKTVYFHSRGAHDLHKAPFQIYGPGANGVTFPHSKVTQYPSTTAYLSDLFDMPNGAYRYLHIFAKAISGGTFGYQGHDISPDVHKPVHTILKDHGLVVKAVGVVHGPAPAVAYRIEYKGKSIVYSGDTSSKSDNMIKIARGADMLIYDTAIMDDIPNGPRDAVFYKLHTTPSRMGEVAAAAMPKTLVLSHLTPNTLPRLDQVKQKVRGKGYKGKIVVAHDLAVYNLGDSD
ncbi:MAG TPA: MBL fold metallo-hydrolase [Gammaproteobacteria bacterium]|nr:MBL fold metallo-hydrolase [Gammaproteobacteria bacterium]